MKLPKGFLASGVRAGIRKKRPDLGLIVATGGANAAAVFTQNRFQAAPVLLAKSALKKSGGRVTAVVVNAGCANAVTGREGMEAANSPLLLATDAADELAAKGIPFREAHEIVSRDFAHSKNSVEAVLAKKDVLGGTNPDRVKAAARGLLD